MSDNRDGFGSKLGAIAAAAGSAIGLGNIYRFPCLAGENGGGAFLLIYVLVGAIDEELTARAYIVPGLGDAGDLAYGRKE